MLRNWRTILINLKCCWADHAYTVGSSTCPPSCKGGQACKVDLWLECAPCGPSTQASRKLTDCFDYYLSAVNKALFCPKPTCVHVRPWRRLSIDLNPGPCLALKFVPNRKWDKIRFFKHKMIGIQFKDLCSPLSANGFVMKTGYILLLHSFVSLDEKATVLTYVASKPKQMHPALFRELLGWSAFTKENGKNESNEQYRL